jgi:hypothetical protein
MALSRDPQGGDAVLGLADDLEPLRLEQFARTVSSSE